MGGLIVGCPIGGGTGLGIGVPMNGGLGFEYIPPGLIPPLPPMSGIPGNGILSLMLGGGGMGPDIIGGFLTGIVLMRVSGLGVPTL